MKKKTLWRDIKKCFSKSKGRFISILCLVALGSFALVGLQVAGPDMRQTGEHYFERLKLADVSVIGDYGIDANDRAAIDRVSGAERIAYGYLKDVVLTGTETSLRVFSETDGISEYELVEGRMPVAEDEVALASFLSDAYSIGDTLSVMEKEDLAGSTVLKHHELKLVGFVNSGELLSIINMGQSTAGTGELQGYAVVPEAAFDSEVYMIARLSFSDTKDVDPYSDAYTDRIEAHKAELNSLLAEHPSMRLVSIKEEYQAKIDDAQAQLDAGRAELTDACDELTAGEEQLAEARLAYQAGMTQYQTQSISAIRQLAAAQQKLTSAERQIEDAEAELAEKCGELETAEAQLTQARSDLDAGWASYEEKTGQLEELNRTKAQLDAAQAQLDAEIAAAESATGMTIEQIAAALPTLEQTLPQEQYEQLCALVAAKAELERQWAAYRAAAEQAAGADEQLRAAKAELERGGAFRCAEAACGRAERAFAEQAGAFRGADGLSGAEALGGTQPCHGEAHARRGGGADRRERTEASRRLGGICRKKAGGGARDRRCRGEGRLGAAGAGQPEAAGLRARHAPRDTRLGGLPHLWQRFQYCRFAGRYFPDLPLFCGGVGHADDHDALRGRGAHQLRHAQGAGL